LDAVSNFLIERGSPGVVIKKNEVQAFFDCPEDSAVIRQDVQRFLRGIRGIYPQTSEDQLRWRVLKDRNWNSSWRRFFSPQRIGREFVVAPPWAKLSRLGRRHVIVIEPGMAFGTGTHATTRGCLELIEQATQSLRQKHFTALDVGTGSGILSIALIKMGATRVTALDNDPVALKVADENLRCNGVEKQVYLSGRSISDEQHSFPITVANLTAETILEIAEPLARSVAPKGALIVSGILKTKAARVVKYFRDHGFRLQKRTGDKEWVTLLLRRK
jgi:ribosomal protein L11 methyltransferase